MTRAEIRIAAAKRAVAKDRNALLERERRLRRSGDWGPWETLDMLPGTVGSRGWLAMIVRAHRNRVFSVLERPVMRGVTHLAVSSLSGIRPSWHEMQRIKDEIAGRDVTAVEIYPPAGEVVDEADMFHIWTLPGPLPFGLRGDAG